MHGTEGVGHLAPGSDYDWPLLPGTRGVIEDSLGDEWRVRFPGNTSIWVKRTAVKLITGDSIRSLRVGNPRIESASDAVELHLPANAPPVYQVMESDNSLSLEILGVVGLPSHRVIESPDPLVLRTLSSRSANRSVVTMTLRGPLYGYEVNWTGHELVLRVRRPPALSQYNYLSGLVIAIDPGHPPGGAVGPLGTRESRVTLAVARRLSLVLASRGAKVLLTRVNDRPVELQERIAIARRANANAFVSIHLDGVPSGSDPAPFEGTAVFAFHSHSFPLALTTHLALLKSLGLRNRGVRRGDFAVLRPTWMPAILCEGATITIPDEEAALRTANFQQKYAIGISEGIETYFAALAKEFASRKVDAARSSFGR